MQDFILIALIALILGGAAAAIIRAKKRGVKCVGCPNGGCAGCKGCGCSK